MPDSTLRIVAEGQLAELREYVALIERADRALGQFNRTAASAPAGPGGGQLSPAGSAMMGPSAPGPSPASTWSEDAMTEIIPGRLSGRMGQDIIHGVSPAMAEAKADAMGKPSPAVAPSKVAPTPSAPSAPSEGDRGATQAAMFRAATSGSASTAGSLIGGAAGGALGAALGGYAGGKVDSLMGPSGSWQRTAFSALTLNPAGALYHGTIAAGRTAYSAAAWGIGEDPIAMVLGSGSRYMQISKALTQVAQTFREASQGATTFGNSLGYTLDRSVALSQALGAQTNALDPVSGANYLGFARGMGLDPMSAMGTFGGMQRIQGRPLSPMELIQMGGQARKIGMGQGRFGEQTQALLSIMEQAEQRTGHADASQAGALSMFAAHVFRREDGTFGDLGLGAKGAGFIQRLSAGFDRPAVQSTMLRAMGYGQAGGPSYVDSMQKIEAGVNDTQNLAKLYNYLRADGVGGDGLKVVFKEAFGLRMHEASSLVEALSNPEVMRYMSGDAGAAEAASSYVQGLKPEQRAALRDGGLVGLGRSAISAGEGYETQKEALVMKFGPQMAALQLDILKATSSVAQSIKNLLGEEFSGSVKKATGAVAAFAEQLEDATSPMYSAESRKAALDATTGAASQWLWSELVTPRPSPLKIQGR